jgi:hypothetical protein
MYIEQPKKRAGIEGLSVNDPSIEVDEGKYKTAQACVALETPSLDTFLTGTSYHVIFTSTPLSHHILTSTLGHLAYALGTAAADQKRQKQQCALLKREGWSGNVALKSRAEMMARVRQENFLSQTQLQRKFRLSPGLSWQLSPH